MSPNVFDKATPGTALVRLDVWLAVCAVLGALLLPRLFRAASVAFAEVRGRRARRAGKALMADFAAGNWEAVVAAGRAGAVADAATLAYEVTALCELRRPQEVQGRLDAALAATPQLRSASALQTVLETLATDLEFGCERAVDGALLQTVVSRFAAWDVGLDDSAQDVLVDALDALGEAGRVEAVLLARPAAAGRGYARLAAAALAREDLFEAERSIEALQRHELFVPAHLCTALLRRVLQVRGPRAALAMVEEDRVALSAEGLASILQSCSAAGPDEGCLRAAVELARTHQVPMLLGAFEALVKGFAAAGGPENEAEAVRYFDEMGCRGFELTARACAALIGACAGSGSLAVARHVFDVARELDVASSEVYCAMIEVLRTARQLHEAAGWLEDLEARGLLQAIELLPSLVDACGEAGRLDLARAVLAKGASKDPDLADRVVRLGVADAAGCFHAALATISDAEERGVALYPETYTRVQRAMRAAGDRVGAEAVLARAVKRRAVDPDSFHARIEASTWQELHQAGEEPPVLASMRAAMLLPTARTFAVLIEKALAEDDRAGAWDMVALAEQEVGVTEGVLAPLLASAQGGELDRLLALAQAQEPEAVQDVAPGLLAACLRGQTLRPLRAAVQLVSAAECTLEDAALAHLVDRARNADQVRELLRLVAGPGFAATRSAAVAALPREEAEAAARASEDARVYGALITALAGRDRERALAVHDEVLGDAMDVPVQARAALAEACAKAGEAASATRVFRAALAAGHVLPAPLYEVLAIAHCVAGDLGPAQELASALAARGLPRSRRLLAALLDTAARKGDAGAAETLLGEMEAQGFVTAQTLASLVRLAGKCQDLARADAWLADLPAKHGFDRNTPQVHSALARACAQCGDLRRARTALDACLAGPGAEAAAVTAVVLACLKAADAAQAAEVAERSLDAGVPLDPAVVSHLRDAKHGLATRVLTRLEPAPAAAAVQRGKRPAQAWRANVAC